MKLTEKRGTLYTERFFFNHAYHSLYFCNGSYNLEDTDSSRPRPSYLSLCSLTYKLRPYVLCLQRIRVNVLPTFWYRSKQY